MVLMLTPLLHSPIFPPLALPFVLSPWPPLLPIPSLAATAANGPRGALPWHLRQEIGSRLAINWRRIRRTMLIDRLENVKYIEN